ncbi:MAG: M48 family metalloprotease [Verrucomicrobiota bacterium]
MNRSRVFPNLLLFLAVVTGLPSRGESASDQAVEKRSQHATAPIEKAEAGESQDLLSTLLNTAAQAAKQIDRIGLQMTRMTDSEESEVGAEIDKKVILHTPVVKDLAIQGRIDRLAGPLIDQRRRRAIKFTVKIVDSSDANAYSAAGGYVYLTQGFLKEFPSDAAIVMAIGHEIGHVDLRHCVEKVQYEVAGRQIIGDFAAIAQVAYGTLSSAYTKEQEFDADKYGFESARRVGWQRQELLDLLSSLIAYEEHHGTSDRTSGTNQIVSASLDKVFRYLASHPATSERLRKLQAMPDKPLEK